MVSAIITLSITIGCDDAPSPGPLASKRAVCVAPHDAHPSKEVK
jgi:hypothetical protein